MLLGRPADVGLGVVGIVLFGAEEGLDYLTAQPVVFQDSLLCSVKGREFNNYTLAVWNWDCAYQVADGSFDLADRIQVVVATYYPQPAIIGVNDRPDCSRVLKANKFPLFAVVFKKTFRAVILLPTSIGFGMQVIWLQWLSVIKVVKA